MTKEEKRKYQREYMRKYYYTKTRRPARIEMQGGGNTESACKYALKVFGFNDAEEVQALYKNITNPPPRAPLAPHP